MDIFVFLLAYQLLPSCLLLVEFLKLLSDLDDILCQRLYESLSDINRFGVTGYSKRFILTFCLLH
jgi:hypothetical protein